MRTTHHARCRCAQSADHLANSHPFSALFAEVVCTVGTTPTKATLVPSPNGGNGVIRTTTRRRHAASRLLMLQNPHRHRHEGRRRVRRAWLRCPWAAAGPGRASSRRAEPHISNPAPQVWRAPEGPEGTGGHRGAAPNAVRPPSLAGGRALRRPQHQRGHKQTSNNQRHTASRSVL